MAHDGRDASVVEHGIDKTPLVARKALGANRHDVVPPTPQIEDEAAWHEAQKARQPSDALTHLKRELQQEFILFVPVETRAADGQHITITKGRAHRVRGGALQGEQRDILHDDHVETE
jgi:hypothetical protein